MAALAYDLHIHTCLSPCGDDDMTPPNVANMAALMGLSVIAVTDHNSCRNAGAVMAAAEQFRLPLTVIPGMEVTTSEEVHVVCLFPGLDRAIAFQELVYRRLGDRVNDPDIFGRQLLMDVDDRILGEEPRMLAGATDIGVYEVHRLVESYGGVAYPAHIDRDSFSLLSNLGLWDPALGFPLAEVSRRCPPDLFRVRGDLRGVPALAGSDAHYPDQIQDAHQWMEVPARSTEAVLAWLRRGGM